MVTGIVNQPSGKLVQRKIRRVRAGNDCSSALILDSEASLFWLIFGLCCSFGISFMRIIVEVFAYVFFLSLLEVSPIILDLHRLPSSSLVLDYLRLSFFYFSSTSSWFNWCFGLYTFQSFCGYTSRVLRGQR